MSYKTYITEALVCGAEPRNTSDKSYLLFTREAGMLYATAQSVREERSKQRYALQEFSHIRATLIRGRNGWKVAGAESFVNTFSIQETREARAMVRNIVRLIRRFMHGEVAYPIFFDETVRVLGSPCGAHAQRIEEVYTVRMLHTLGYIAPHEAIDPLLSEEPIERVVEKLDEHTARMRREIIEQALHASHL